MTTQEEVLKTATTAWKALANILPLNTEQEFSSTNLAETAKINQASAGRALRFMRGLKLITYRSEYGALPNGGQKVYMTRFVELDEGMTTIYKHFDAGRSYSYFESGQPGGGPIIPRSKADRIAQANARQAELAETAPVTIARSDREEVRAIAGPEPEKPMESLREIRKDEPEALIEAARQYTNRGAAVQAKMRELADLGVTVDADMLAKAIHFEVDERLETIAAILPLIDRLERQGVRNAGDREELMELRRSVSVLTKERNALQAANKRLSERNVALVAASKTEPVAARA